MKSLKSSYKLVALVLSAFIFFQGCNLYKSANVTLDEAVEASTRTRIKTKDKKTLKFNKIVFENDQYYGKTQYGDKLIKVGIDEDNIEILQVKDRGKTILLNIGIPVVLVGIFLAGISVDPF